MVIVTYLPWHNTFRKLLDIFGQLRNRSDEEFRDFITTVYKETVPDPGATLKIFYDNRECVSVFNQIVFLNINNIFSVLRVSKATSTLSAT